MKITYGLILSLSFAAIGSFAAVMSSLPTKVESEFPVESQSYTGAFSSVLTNELIKEESTKDDLVDAKNLTEDSSPEGQNSGATSSVLSM
jgi:hypothetical protein